MSKLVRRLRPIDYWRIAENESWLMDMAAKGLHLKKMGLRFATFEVGEPKDTRYRIDVAVDNNVEPHMKEIFFEGGWEYVTRNGDFNIYSSPPEFNAVELYKNPVEQGATFKELYKKMQFTSAIASISMLIIFAFQYFIWFYRNTSTLVLIEGRFINQVFLSAFLFFSAINSIQAMININRVRNSLLEGRYLNHNAPWRRHRKITILFVVLYVIALNMVITIPYIQYRSYKMLTLPTESVNIPLVRLADIEKNPGLIREEIRDYSTNEDMLNWYSYEWSIFAPSMYYSYESGVVSDVKWRDSNEEYSPAVTTRVYRLRYAIFAEGLVKDLVTRYGMTYRGKAYTPQEHPDFDVLIVNEYSDINVKEIFASKDRVVTFVRYNGYRDIDEIISITAKKLDEFTKMHD